MSRLTALTAALLGLFILPQWQPPSAQTPGGQQVEAIAQAGKNLASKGCKSLLGRAQEFTRNVGSTGLPDVSGISQVRCDAKVPR